MSKKNLSSLVKKVISDKNGKRRTVWVKVEGNKKYVKRAKTDALTSKYSGIIRKVNSDLDTDSKDYKQALALKFIMLHGIRVGNESSAEGFKRHGSKKVESTYGLLTLQPKHIISKGTKVIVIFKGKKSVVQKIEISNKSIIDGLLHFKSKADKGEPVLGMTNYELRKYINRKVGKEFSPKDFRMMRANIEAKKKVDEIIRRKNTPSDKTEVNKEVNEVLDHVAKELGNTNKVAKRSYVDDIIINDFIHKRLKGVKRK